MGIADYVLVTRPQGAPIYDGGLLDRPASVTTVFAAGADTDTESSAQALGFAINLFGVVYDEVYVSCRGYLRFAGSALSEDNADLFAANDGVVLAPWWDSLQVADDGDIVSWGGGTAPARYVVFDFTCYAASGQDSSDNTKLPFQVVLWEFGRVEFRYGGSTTTGTPLAVDGASIGFKDDTTSTSTNRRDASATGYYLGGSTSSTTTNLDPATDWPADAATPYNLLLEVNRPVPALADWVDPTELAGRNRPDAEPIVKAGRLSNFVLARHAPALVNFCPYADEAATQTFVLPVRPSIDSRSYRFQLATYSTAGAAGANPTCVVSEGVDTTSGSFQQLAAPQGGTSTHWRALGTITKTLHTADAVEWWTAADIVVPARVRFLRLVVANNDGANKIALLACIVTPTPVDELGGTDYRPSGAVPFALGQVLQPGASVGPEILNRPWRTLGETLRDLEQCVASFVQDVASVKKGAGSSAARGHVLMWRTPASLPGQRGVTLTVRVYAYDTTGGGKLTVAIAGGDSVTFTLGTAYRLFEGTLVTTSEHFVVEATASPVGIVRIGAVIVTHRPGAS